jgi:hypothetical protein
VAKKTSGAESEYHIVGVRMRVVGEGSLDLSLSDLDSVQTLNLVSLTMQPTTRIEPTRLANFQSQRTRLIGSTSEIDEWFLISRIIIFAKAVAIEYPG